MRLSAKREKQPGTPVDPEAAYIDAPLLGSIIDVPAVQALMDDFHALTGLPIGVIDLEGRVLVGTGWQDLCTRFHRANPETLANCVESDLALTRGLVPGAIRQYKCKNGVWDIVTPLFVGDLHVGNIFVGQFFYEDEAPDMAFFEQQAERYGFDRDEYLAAVLSAPRFSHATVDGLMRFYTGLAGQIAGVGYANLMLARSEGALKASEERYRAIAANTPDHVLMQDMDLRYTVAINPQMGLTQADMIGHTDHHFLDADDADRLTEIKRRVIETGEAYELETSLQSRAGVTEHFEGAYVPTFAADGRPSGLVGYFRDVTERHRADEELARERRQLRAVEAAARIGAWRLDLITGAVTGSDETHRIYGLDPVTFTGDLGEAIAAAVHPDDRARVEAETAESVVAKTARSMDYRILAPGGAVRWVHTEGHVEVGDDDEAIALVGFVQDVTARVAAEEALRESEDKFRYVFDHSVIGKSITLASGEVNVNEAFAHMIGYSREELQHVRWQDVTHPDDIDSTSREMEELTSGRAESVRFEKRYLRKDGGVVWTLVSSSLRRDACGEPLYFMTAMVDITERKRAEQDADRRARQSALLSESALALIGCRTSEEVFEVVRRSAEALVPGSVVLLNGCAPDASQAVVRAVTGLDDTMLAQVTKILGLQLVGMRVEVKERDRHRFYVSALEEIPEGFTAYVSGAVPAPVIRAAVKAFGLGRTWLVGITDGTATFGNISIVARESDPVIPAHAVESLARQAFLELERLHAEAALVTSHDLLAHLTQQVPGVVYQYRLYLDGRSCFPYSSTGIRDIYEVTPEEVREDATPVFGRIHPEDLDAIAESIQVSARDQSPYHSEFRVVLPRQGVRWRSCDANPRLMEDGSTLWYGIITDITDRKSADDALRQSEERYRSISETVTSFVYSCVQRHGEDLHLDWMAGAVQEMTGYCPDEIIERSCWRFMVLPEDLPLFEESVTGLAPGRSATADLRIVTATGEVLWVRSSARASVDPATGVHRLVGSCEDATARREAELLLVSANERLEGVLRSITETMGKVVETRDPYTQGHQIGVARIGRLIAEEMGLEPEDVHAIEIAALVHDIGKLSVPAEILIKPGALSATEFALIRQHSRAGYEILRDIDFGWPIADIVLQHHERIDGSGYPQGLAGEEIAIAARVLAVADVVDAMASHRPYRPARGIDAAAAEISGHPEKYGADAAAAFARLNGSGRLGL